MNQGWDIYSVILEDPSLKDHKSINLDTINLILDFIDQDRNRLNESSSKLHKLLENKCDLDTLQKVCHTYKAYLPTLPKIKS